MTLKKEIIEYLNESARRAGGVAPALTDDLFEQGVIDSFTLVEFVCLLEEQLDIKIPDSDINPDNFRTMQTIEQYIQKREEQA